MTKVWTRIILSVVALGVLAFIIFQMLSPAQAPLTTGGKAGAPQIGLYKGDMAPNFTVSTLEGQRVSLSDYRGRPVMLNFWSVNCEGCQMETPGMQKVYTAMRQASKDIVILGVNLADGEPQVQKFVRAYGITYQIARDQGAVASTMYALRGTPTSYFIDRQGIIREKAEGAISEEDLQRVLEGISIKA